MNGGNSKESYFVKSAFFRFFTASMLSSFGLAISDVVDSLLVGRMIGEPGLAAIAFIMPIFMIYNTIHQSLSVGGSQLYLNCLSENRLQKAAQVFSSVVIFSAGVSGFIALSGVFFCDPILHFLGVPFDDPNTFECSKAYALVLFGAAPIFFFRYVLYNFVFKDDNPKLATIALLSGNLTDFILNFVFVIGMKMGTSGAIWSTVIGYAISCLICLPHFFSKNSTLHLHFYKFNIQDVKESLQIGMATGSQYAYQFVTMIIINNIVIRIGGSTGMATLNVMLNFLNITTSFSTGNGTAIQPMVSTYYAEHNRSDIKETLRLSVTYGFSLILVLSLASAVFAPFICRFFGMTEVDAIQLGSRAIRIYCIANLPAFFNILACNYYQSVNAMRMTYLINLARTFVFMLLFSFIFAFSTIQWFWLSWPAAEGLTLICWLIYSIRRHNILFLPENDTGKVLHLSLDSSNTDINQMLEKSSAFFEEHNGNSRQSYFASMAVEEICSAIILNAFQKKTDEYIQVTMIAEDGGDFVLHIRDSAIRFNPFEMNTKKIELDDDSGLDALGILMIKKKAKEFNYRKYYGFNTTYIRI